MKITPDCITLIQPDDWHVHFREGMRMSSVAVHTAEQCGRAIVMPNLVPPVVSCEQAVAYHAEIKQATAAYPDFQPLMTLYLTETTPLEEIRKIPDSCVQAVKLYPAGATTNSASGVHDTQQVYPQLEEMQRLGIPLLVHGEVVDAGIDIFDREKFFIDRVLTSLVKTFPDLKVVCEHITTAEMVDFVRSASECVAATITPQHLLFDRNAMLVGGIRPHYYCLPILKRASHRHALVEAAISGSPKFFAGSDSAPHAINDKHTACGCAGVFSAPLLLELYATLFDQANALEKLEGFVSRFGAGFYGLPLNTRQVCLQRMDWQVADTYQFGDAEVVPLMHGETLHWKLVAESSIS